MTAFWTQPDYDDHEVVHFVHDRASGLRAIIAMHSTHLGPAAGGTRFWHYAEPGAAIVDALRLSRGMSYKNAMAGLKAGGGKAVILADKDRTKTPEMLQAFARAVEGLGGRYITAQDVGMSEQDMVDISQHTQSVAGLPGGGGGSPGPYTARGVFLGIKAAVKRALGVDSLEGVHVALQGVGSVGGGTARHLAEEGARLTLADVDSERAQALGKELGASVVASDEILAIEADVFSPNALGAVITEEVAKAIKVKAVAGGANNQLATGSEGRILAERGILYAPDYVINAGGIITVMRIIDDSDNARVHAKIDEIPGRLQEIWAESEANGLTPAEVADAMAKKLIGR
ncbi:Leu/Phe/Val dehydrogenase [Altererythrobacter sp. MF3-039]|uniref:Leu/Phe/Val dehydrogenase n=1 Tax=Altererythrobacter sp. MF3-039 TaxID=3252901 RepID=UPI00390C7277